MKAKKASSRGVASRKLLERPRLENIPLVDGGRREIVGQGRAERTLNAVLAELRVAERGARQDPEPGNPASAKSGDEDGLPTSARNGPPVGPVQPVEHGEDAGSASQCAR